MSANTCVLPKISPYAIPGLKYQPPMGQAKPEILTQIIFESVGDFYSLTRNSIVARSRKREVCLARQIICLLLKRFTKYSLKRIGSLVSETGKHRDHTTVIHSIQTVKDLMHTDELVALHVNKLIEDVETRFIMFNSINHSHINQ